MNKNMSSLRKKFSLRNSVTSNKGFTLIEILVVVFIIGLLASVVLVGLGSFRARGRDARRVADLRSIQNILELYYAKEGEYPSSVNWGSLEDDIKGAGIGVGNIPNDPNEDATYAYGVDTTYQRYVLRAELEDSGHALLRNDVDGGGSENYGVDCEDSVHAYYCIKF